MKSAPRKSSWTCSKSSRQAGEKADNLEPAKDAFKEYPKELNLGISQGRQDGLPGHYHRLQIDMENLPGQFKAT